MLHAALAAAMRSCSTHHAQIDAHVQVSHHACTHLCAAGAKAVRAARAVLRRDALSAAASSLESLKQQVVAALARLLAFK